ncbi:hypothetical protein C1645_877756 [Glomus cerebriforme]|uniref:Uncharacterized protein n=1 Tax=Glomus cerebriforme TaxID=658196 RepID=A0A397SNY0_9GLOM|nr:hypothetical protein C1645_877756 [Glomus cerebriforme]
MTSESYQGIFIPYSGKPEEIKINIESGDIRQKLNCEFTDHVTLWAKNHNLCLFCDDFSVKKHLPANPLATRLVYNLFGNYPSVIRGNVLLLDDEKKVTIKDLSSLLKEPLDAFHTEEIANCLLTDLLQSKFPNNFSSEKNSCTIQILCREVAGKENKSQFQSKIHRMCYVGEDMESVSVDDWDYIVVQAKNIHRIKMVDSKKSLRPILKVFIDGKQSVFRDESIINNKKNSETLCRFLLSANEVLYSEYVYENDIIANLIENINKLRHQFKKSSLKPLDY